jgi:predicted Rossmann fold flavoprotein
MRIAVVGGGAAGFFGAVSAASQLRSAEIVIFEAGDQPLEKVRVSGGGRCNVTHHCFDPAELVNNYPRGHKELRGPFSRFQPRDTVEWFAQHGVQIKAEDDGRMFPVTDDSGTIIDCLLTTSRDLGIQLRRNARVKSIAAVSGSSDHPQFEIECHDATPERFDRVLLATGSEHQGYRFAQALGHTIVPCVPSLFTFKITDNRLADLSGISFTRVHLAISSGDSRKLEQTGPMLITHWGLSGPAVLKLSAWGARILHDCHYHAELTVNFLPDMTPDQLTAQLLTYKQNNPKKFISTESPVPIPKRYWSRIVQYVGIADETKWTHLSKDAMTSIVAELSRARFAISGKGIFKEEFVTCGGVDLKEVDFKTMQSKLCPGLYLAGEILDIDGITGGFNFQSAWTTGWIAGMSMVL